MEELKRIKIIYTTEVKHNFEISDANNQSKLIYDNLMNRIHLDLERIKISTIISSKNSEYYEIKPLNELCNIMTLVELNKLILCKIKSGDYKSPLNIQYNSLEDCLGFNFLNYDTCGKLIKLLKKSKGKIDNFTHKHIYPLSPLIEESFTDFINSLQNELQTSLNFTNIQLRQNNIKKSSEDIYDLQIFNYDEKLLHKIDYNTTIKIFKFFFETCKYSFPSKNDEKIFSTNSISSTQTNFSISILPNRIKKLELIIKFLKEMLEGAIQKDRKFILAFGRETKDFQNNLREMFSQVKLLMIENFCHNLKINNN